MKLSKIAWRLILYFFIALLLFALIVGGAFAALSAQRTLEQHRQDLRQRAETIADTMYGFLSGSAQPMNGGHNGQGHGNESSGLHGTGFGAYMRFLDDLAMADVWVVDSNSKTITPSSDHHTAPIEYGELPPDGEALIDRALQGEAAFSESFSDVLGERTLSVVVPIRADEASPPLGAVLLHTPVSGISDAVWDSLRTMLGSVLIALLLAVPAGILLSLKFTRPVDKMKATAVRLAEGDLTAKNHIPKNDEIGELAQAMDQMADKLREAAQERERLEQARHDFISNISHELRTPVTVLRGSLEAFADGVVTDPEQVKEYQQQMLTESKHLQRLVDDMLELFRLENADFQIEKSPLELRQLIDDTARSMRRVAEPKGVRLELFGENREFPFVGDYGRLRQMLVVVMDNAIKFSPPGGTVSLSLKQEAAGPVISVADQGPGISEEKLPHIFERFSTSGGTGNRSGTGLGLPIALQIAKRHNVEIGVKSRPGETVFSFWFPPA